MAYMTRTQCNVLRTFTLTNVDTYPYGTHAISASHKFCENKSSHGEGDIRGSFWAPLKTPKIICMNTRKITYSDVGVGWTPCIWPLTNACGSPNMVPNQILSAGHM